MFFVFTCSSYDNNNTNIQIKLNEEDIGTLVLKTDKVLKFLSIFSAGCKKLGINMVTGLAKDWPFPGKIT